MAFSQLIGQERAKRMLSRLIASHRVGGTYLFFGPEGVGKRTTALLFAQALNCAGPDAAEGEPCGACPSCRKILHGNHPDIRYLFPLSRAGKGALDDLLHDARWGEHGPRFDRAASISIEGVRDLRHEIAHRPFVGRMRAVIVCRSERMTTEAANAFLKMLEEPPPATIYVLTTARPQALLATVRSRCQPIPFARLASESIEHALIDRFGIDQVVASASAGMANGSLGRALDLATGSLEEERQQALDLMQTAGTGLEEVPELVQKLARQSDRGEIQRMLELLLTIWRDVMVLKVRARAHLVNEDLGNELTAEGRDLSLDEIVQTIRAIDETLRAVEGNVNVGLALAYLVSRLSRGMGGAEVWARSPGPSAIM